MDSVLRYRAWIVMGVVLVVVLLAVLVAGKPRRSPATEVHVRFGPLVKPPVGPAKLTFINGWVASSGRSLVAVYVGSQPHHPRNGLILVTVHVPGAQPIDGSELIAGSGTLTLLRPARPSSIQGAAQTKVRLVTANGYVDSLSLASNRFRRKS